VAVHSSVNWWMYRGPDDCTIFVPGALFSLPRAHVASRVQTWITKIEPRHHHPPPYAPLRSHLPSAPSSHPPMSGPSPSAATHSPVTLTSSLSGATASSPLPAWPRRPHAWPYTILPVAGPTPTSSALCRPCHCGCEVFVMEMDWIWMECVYVWVKLIKFGCNLIMLYWNWVNLIKVD
jgi:hypothetical protein